jgi:hypothetical protein
LLKVPSPDRKFQLLIEQAPTPDNPGEVFCSFSICDAEGKVIKKLGKTNFAVVAIKWHKTANAAVVLEHISHQVIMNLIYLDDGIWEMGRVRQFEDPPGVFKLLDAESDKASFKFYYLASERGNGEYTAIRTELNIRTLDATLKSAKRVNPEDLPFYKDGPGDILFQLEHASANKPLHCESLDEGADWFGLREGE